MQIYIYRNEQQSGPHSLEEIRSHLAGGTLQPGDLAWYEGAADWLPVSSVPGAAMRTPAPRPAAPAARGIMASGPVRERVRERSRLAVASMVLGLVGLALVLFVVTGIPAVIRGHISLAPINNMKLDIAGVVLVLFMITGIPAVICGHIGLARIHRPDGVLGGKWFAIAGLVTGYIDVFFTLVVAILAGIVFWIAISERQYASATGQEMGMEIHSLINAKEIALACKKYASDNGGKFPGNLEQLFPAYLKDHDVLIDPMDPTHMMGFQYFGGKESDPPGRILLESQIVKDHKRVVAHVDGSGMLQAE